MAYKLTLYAYCGMSVPLVEEGDLEECRAAAARMIRRHRNVLEYPVAVLERGRKWELETGVDAVMIGDLEGVLKIEEVEEPEPDFDEDDFDDGICDGCGENILHCECEYDDEDEAEDDE